MFCMKTTKTKSKIGKSTNRLCFFLFEWPFARLSDTSLQSIVVHALIKSRHNFRRIFLQKWILECNYALGFLNKKKKNHKTKSGNSGFKELIVTDLRNLLKEKQKGQWKRQRQDRRHQKLTQNQISSYVEYIHIRL